MSREVFYNYNDFLMLNKDIKASKNYKIYGDIDGYNFSKIEFDIL